MTPTQVLRPNRRDCHQRRGISHHQPLQYSIDRPAPTRLPEAVIWIADPKVPEISNPWDVEPSGEVARDDQPSKRRRTAKDDIRLPFFDQSFAGGNNRLDPVPSHVRNVNQSVVMALNPVQSRVAQPPASPGDTMALPATALSGRRPKYRHRRSSQSLRGRYFE